MPCWPLLLPPPAVSTSTSLARFLVVHCRRVTITLSLAVELPLLSRSRRPSPSRRVLHHPQFAIAPSITAHRRCALVPSPPRSCRPSPTRSRCAVPHRRGAVAPSLAVEEQSCRPLPSPSRSHRTVPRRRRAIAPSIAVEEPSRRTLPSRSRRPCLLTTPANRHAPPRPLVRMVVALPLLTPPLSICRCLSLRHRLSFEVIFRVVVSFGVARITFHVYVPRPTRIEYARIFFSCDFCLPSSLLYSLSLFYSRFLRRRV